jgi:hypothetical protein
MNAPAVHWPTRPSPFDWQVLAISPTRAPHLMQFFHKHYTRDEVIRRADFEANWYGYPAFAVRDPQGRVVHIGPVLDALGNPKHPDAWRELCAERRAA